MQFVNVDFSASRDEVLAMLADNERVNERVRFDESRGKPLVKIKDKSNGKVKISCEMIGGPSKDNGFIQGTAFTGKLTEKNGVTRLKGIITTEPIYHFIFLAMLVFFIVQCFRFNGFSVVPPILVIFNFVFLKNEYKKQGYIKRYLMRAARRINQQ